MKKLLLCLVLSSASYHGIAQTNATTNTPVTPTFHGGNKSARFGDHPSAIADYLTAQHVLSGETIAFKRAVFRLLIDNDGKVTEAKLFYGGIAAATEEKTIAAMYRMPAWKTTLKAGEQSMVYVVVQVKEQVITTELY